MRDNTVVWFDGPEHYVDYLHNIPGQYKNLYNDRFSGGSFDQALTKLINGDRSGLDKAQSIINQMIDAQLFSIGRPSIVSDMVGFMPNVPNAIMGQPNDMFRIVEDEDTTLTSPLRVFVETTVSAGLTHDELISRGVAVLAFVLAMNTMRSVELYTASFGRIHSDKEHGAIVRIPTNPIDLDRAVYMLAGVGFCRQLMFTTVSYQAKYTNSHSIPFGRNCRDICKCEPHDVLLEGGHLSDTLMLNDPITWVKQMIKKHSASNLGG